MNIASLQAIMLSIAEARSLGPILEEIVKGVASAFDLALARLWLIETDAACPVCGPQSNSDDQISALHLRASAGRTKAGAEVYTRMTGGFHRIPLGERKIGQIAKAGEPMLIKRVSGRESWVADADWIQREAVRSFAGQPLKFRGETLGVLAVFSRTEFSEEEFRWLRTFADHAAVAIANARAFEQLARLKAQLEAENEYLHSEIRETSSFGEIVGHSPALRKVLDQVALVADTNATVLLLGESGTGKELIARAIHDQSARKERPFIKVNCGAIPKELFESEFFGHVKGAFTGAVKDRIGRFELAQSGDLFLDEIGEIPLAHQPKLLRVLQEKQFERVGEGRTRTVDVRVIAATNRDLRAEVEAGRFREDLYYRLSVFPVEIPPLRQRKEDIPILAEHFLRKSAAKLKMKAPRLAPEIVRQLQQYDWPGNIRELEHVMERATILSRRTGKLSFDVREQQPRKRSVRKTFVAAEEPQPPRKVLTDREIQDREVENILRALEEANGKISGPGGAAEILGVRPTTLASRLKALGLRKSYSRGAGLE